MIQLEPKSHSTMEWYYYVIYSATCLFCVCFAGLMSGLTLGLLSIDKMTLNILKTTGTKKEQYYARKIAPVLKNHHHLLVTLLLCNATAMETLPLFLDKMVPEVIAVLLSVTFVLFFGEIIPQAVCARYGLAIGGNLAWLVKVLLVITFPISFPISKLLDCVLGHDSLTFFRRAQLKELVSIHGDVEHGGYLTLDEIHVIRGALDMKEKTVDYAMTNVEDVYMLNYDTLLTSETIQEIIKRGHSRVPVYRHDRNNIIGILLVKSLLAQIYDKLINGDKTAVSLSTIELRDIPIVASDMPLWDMLNEFQTGKCHMAVIVKPMTEAELQAQQQQQQQQQESATQEEETEDPADVTPQASYQDGDWDSLAISMDPTPVRTAPLHAVSTSYKESPLLARLKQQGNNKQVKRRGSNVSKITAQREKEKPYLKKHDVIGVITLEDIIEEILAEEIYDESDVKNTNDPSNPPLPANSVATGTKIADLVKRIQYSDQMARSLMPNNEMYGTSLARSPALTMKRNYQATEEEENGSLLGKSYKK